MNAINSTDFTSTTILITGGATGIGKAIAQSFITASASSVIIVGRRADFLHEAASELEKHARDTGSSTKVIAQQCDVSDIKQVVALWDDLASSGIHVDVLVSNAASFTEPQSLLDLGIDNVWSQFETNVKGPLYFAERFYKQPGDGQKFFINITTQAIHTLEHPIVVARPAYSLTKLSAAFALQLLANTIPVEKMQIVSFHPGLVYGAGWSTAGITKEMLPFDDIELAGDYAVWAASQEARFLHGRFVWASWDVNELSTGDTGKRIEDDPTYLRIGVIGLRGANRA